MVGSEASDEQAGPGVTGLVVKMVLLVVVGGPMVYVLWEALNHLLSGDADAVRWSIVFPVLVVFSGFVIWLARAVSRWDRAGG